MIFKIDTTKKLAILKKKLRRYQAMQKSIKSLLCAGLVSCMTLGSVMSSLAGTWRQGATPNQSQWWYDFDNGTYAKEGWQWIDGNNDGVAECYYFDKDGWMLANTTTPDGCTVNADGAWTQNGAVQTQGAAQTGQTQQTTGDTLWMWNVGADGSMNENSDVMFADFDNWFSWLNQVGGFGGNDTLERMVARWAQTSERGAAWKALFDKYAIPYNLLNNGGGTITFTTAPGMTSDAEYSAGSAVEMMIWLSSDGMATATWNSVVNADGSVTVVAEVQMMG